MGNRSPLRFTPATGNQTGPRQYGYPWHAPTDRERLTAIEDGLAAAILELDKIVDRLEQRISVLEGRRAA
jgi:hypothetical protein